MEVVVPGIGSPSALLTTIVDPSLPNANPTPVGSVNVAIMFTSALLTYIVALSLPSIRMELTAGSTISSRNWY